MFFHHHITVIYVMRGKLKSAVFSTSGKLLKEEKIYDWKKSTLENVLLEIFKRGPSKVRVVFGEEFSYVTALKSSQKGRMAVLEKAREIIPEDLKNNWDFRVNAYDENLSQVVAVQTETLDFFVENLQKIGFHIEAIEPQSVSLARLLVKKDLAMFFAKDEKILMGVVQNGMVLATYVADKKESNVIWRRFILAMHKKYQGKIENVYFDEEKNQQFLNDNALTPVLFALDPLLGVAIKKHLKGVDAKVLNIESSKNKVSEKADLKDAKINFSRREKILAFLFVAMLVGGFWVIQNKRKIKESNFLNAKPKQIVIQNDPQPAVSLPVEERVVEVVEQEIKVSKTAQELEILILNGGAVPGSAAKMEAFLLKKQYLQVETANAAERNNVGTVVYYQAEKAAAEVITDLLQQKYPDVLLEQASSEEQKSAEIVIILGK